MRTRAFRGIFSLAVIVLVASVGCAPLARRGEVDTPIRADLPAPDGFAAPVLLMAGDEPIDTDIGHAAPFLCDWDSDGDRDLLVGQFGDGKLRIYTNVGTERAPRYEGPTWFEAGGALATVPAG